MICLDEGGVFSVSQVAFIKYVDVLHVPGFLSTQVLCPFIVL